MGSYQSLFRPSSDCVHFFYADQIGEVDQPIRSKLRNARIKYAYIDYQEVRSHIGAHITNAVGQALNLEHSPYGPRTSPHQPERWVPFLDDLITLSYNEYGLAILVDNADDFLLANSREMFGLIEAFLTQVHHWLEKSKPCHLCFQLEKNEWVRRIFAT